MMFETVKTAIETILEAAAGGKFQVIGFQRQSKGAIEVEDDSRFVQVYYASGQFVAGRRPTGPVLHDITYKLEFTVSKAAQADLSVLADPMAAPAAKASALGAMIEAAKLADDSIDELFRRVYNIIMDGRNYDLGLSKGDVANRWINDFQKDEPVPQGELVVLTAMANLNVRVSEDLPGATGTTVPGVYDTTIDIKDDGVEKTGVTVDNT